jgi:hypothetical protein
MEIKTTRQIIDEIYKGSKHYIDNIDNGVKWVKCYDIKVAILDCLKNDMREVDQIKLHKLMMELK